MKELMASWVPVAACAAGLVCAFAEAAGIAAVRYIGPDIAQNREKGADAILAFLKKHFKME